MIKMVRKGGIKSKIKRRIRMAVDLRDIGKKELMHEEEEVQALQENSLRENVKEEDQHHSK